MELKSTLLECQRSLEYLNLYFSLRTSCSCRGLITMVCASRSDFGSTPTFLSGNGALEEGLLLPPCRGRRMSLLSGIPKVIKNRTQFEEEVRAIGLGLWWQCYDHSKVFRIFGRYSCDGMDLHWPLRQGGTVLTPPSKPGAKQLLWAPPSRGLLQLGNG